MNKQFTRKGQIEHKFIKRWPLFPIAKEMKGVTAMKCHIYTPEANIMKFKAV